MNIAIGEPWETSAVSPANGVTEAMQVNHGPASAVSSEADGSYEDEQGGADGSHEEEHRADRSHKDEQGADSHEEEQQGDGSHEDEKKLRADSPAMSDYMLKCSKRDWGEGADGRVMVGNWKVESH
jgi:hypothetical protein